MGVEGPDCFPYLFINVLSSLRETVRHTGSYTLILDDFLHCANKFQLRCNFSERKVFWINSYSQGQHWISWYKQATFWQNEYLDTRLDTTVTSLSFY